MLITRTHYLFLYREPADAPPSLYPVPAGFSVERWTQRGPFDAPPGFEWSWRHLVWWCLFVGRRIPLRAVVIVDTASRKPVHITYVFPTYFRFPFMNRNDLQIGAIVTEPAYRNLGLAKAGLADAIAWVYGEQRRLWFIVKPKNTASIAVGTHGGFTGRLAGQRIALIGLWMLGFFRASDKGLTPEIVRAQAAGAEFVDVSETAQTPVTVEGEQMMLARYTWAAGLARRRDVLEIACGSAQGGVMLSRAAHLYVGGDLSLELLSLASDVARREARLVQFRAGKLPFPNASFDLVLILEAIYYFPDAERVIREAKRILRAGGSLAIVSANPARAGFIRSKYSVEYFPPDRLARLLVDCGFDQIHSWGAFPFSSDQKSGHLSYLFEIVRRVMDWLGLIPHTLQGRARLKRWLFGSLRTLPADLPEAEGTVQLTPHPLRANWSRYKIFYLLSRSRPF